ncbi:hypothetical protein L2K20_18640 [Mycobacterium sp. MBM]|nr:hypothetical protein [Mycobacterium sp. MBM]
MPVDDRWPSLSAQRAVAEAMFGAHGPAMVAEWFAGELSRTGDAAFARSFSDHIHLPGIGPDDYLHRLISTRWGRLLGGIRFYGRDISRPFVEVVAHSFADLGRLAEVVADEWEMFAPGAMRLHTAPAGLRHPRVVLDKTIHAARCREIRSPTTAVTLTPVTRIEPVLSLVAARYRELTPDLARNVAPAGADDLRRWHATGHLHAVCARASVVGVLAVAPGHIGWIDGEEILEEVVNAGHGGHGYAARAQAFWAAHLAPDRDRYLIGTIDRLNTASRKTAEAAGRRRVLDRVFVSLPQRH